MVISKYWDYGLLISFICSFVFSKISNVLALHLNRKKKKDMTHTKFSKHAAMMSPRRSRKAIQITHPPGTQAFPECTPCCTRAALNCSKSRLAFLLNLLNTRRSHATWAGRALEQQKQTERRCPRSCNQTYRCRQQF